MSKIGIGVVLVCLELPEPLGGFHHAGSGPAQSHFGVAPALHVPRDPSDRAHHVFNDVGAGERSAELRWQAEARDREDVVDLLENAAGDAGSDLFDPAREITQQFLSLVSIVEFLCLAETLRTEAWSDFGRQSMIFLDLCTWQRWISVVRPKVWRIALVSAFAPSMMNSFVWPCRFTYL